MTEQLFQLATVVLLAAGLGFLARFFRQPLILAYIATGVVIAYFGWFNLADHATFKVLSDLGIMFLLFLVGLEMNYASLRSVGKASLIVGLGQIVFTAVIGYFLTRFLGFDPLPSLYIAIALTFSSTIIVVKLLSEKHDLSSLYGKISIGFLLVQDFVAILMLIFLSGLAAGRGFAWWDVALTVGKGAFLFAAMFWLGRKILPHILDRIARSPELLFLASLAWVFLLAALVSKIGFSIEIAGFLAGIALANSSEHFQIANRIRSLRDFFILIFFVILGSSVLFSDFSGLGLPVLVLSLFVLIGNPLIVLVIMGILGYRKRTSFMAGVTVAQISEFSLVLAAMGYKVGHLTEAEVSLVTAVGILTITASTYLILYSDRIFKVLARPLSLFERRESAENGRETDVRKPIILIGAHRTGQSIARNLRKEDLLIIDFDPSVAAELKRQGQDHLFGEATDPEVFERAHFDTAKLVISTSPDLADSLALLEELNALPSRPKVILRAETEHEAKALYDAGADYVLLPHFTSGQYLGKTIAVDLEMRILESLKAKDLEMLRRNEASVLNI